MSRNLTVIEGTYSKELLNHLEAIETRYKNPNITLSELRAYITTIVAPAKVTKAKQTFLSRLISKKSKYDVWWLCYNATTCGMLFGSGV